MLIVAAGLENLDLRAVLQESPPIPIRLLTLQKKTKQIERPIEKIGFVTASILEVLTGRHDLYPNFVMNFRGRGFFCRKGTSDWWHVIDEFEPETTEFLSGQQGNVFLDLGAHIGRYSVSLASNFKKVVAVEPLDETFGIPSTNVKHNGLRNTLLVNAALMDKEGRGKLYLPKDRNLGSCSMILASDRFVQVEVTTVDSMLERLGISRDEVSLVKVDVECGEMRLLNGAHNLLAQRSEKLVVETWYLRELQQLLADFGYFMKCKLDSANYLFEKWHCPRLGRYFPLSSVGRFVPAPFYRFASTTLVGGYFEWIAPFSLLQTSLVFHGVLNIQSVPLDLMEILAVNATTTTPNIPTSAFPMLSLEVWLEIVIILISILGLPFLSIGSANPI